MSVAARPSDAQRHHAAQILQVSGVLVPTDVSCVETELEQLLCMHEAHLGLRVAYGRNAQPAKGDVAVPWRRHLQGRGVACQLLPHLMIGWDGNGVTTLTAKQH